MKDTFSILLGLFSICAVAQVKFTVDRTFIPVNKSTDYGTAHDYSQVINKAGDTLHMRWVADHTQHNAAWTVNFQDPENYYTNVIPIDSADFILPDSISNHVFNKMVIGITHNQVPGVGVYEFTLFEIGNPSYSITIVYEVSITPGLQVSSVSYNQPMLYPNPAKNVIYARVLEQDDYNWHILNSSGQIMGRGRDSFFTDELEIDVSGLNSGSYWLVLQSQNQTLQSAISIR